MPRTLLMNWNMKGGQGVGMGGGEGGGGRAEMARKGPRGHTHPAGQHSTWMDGPVDVREEDRRQPT